MRERLQKAMAHAGLGSRRQCEDLIRSGRVLVNGQIAVLGTKVDAALDDIRIDGERMRAAEPHVYVALYKPRGVLSSLRSQGGKPTVGELVPVEQRLYPVGRLDIDSEGLILMMNDGEIAHRLTHPRYGHEKEYRVLLNRIPDDAQLEAWRRGVVLPGGIRTRRARVQLEDPKRTTAWLRVVMREGRKRQIRDVAGSLGLSVRKLIRVRHGPIELGALKPGEFRFLSKKEIGKLTILNAERTKMGKAKVRNPGGSGKPRRRSTRGVVEDRT
ncbi:MAG TPA: rRNA pseudouridine synthase [Anaerolineae bacterium]|nr:rRNA pseudouridine synthase [Anaerolineae bacterium]